MVLHPPVELARVFGKLPQPGQPAGKLPNPRFAGDCVSLSLVFADQTENVHGVLK